MKRVISVVMLLALLCSFQAASASDDDIPDYITKTTVNEVEYLVFDSGEDMVWLRNHVMNMEDGADEEGKYYCTHNIILAADIDMADYNDTDGSNNGQWSGIGWGQKWIGYSGIFDGNGHTIYNIEVYTNTPVGPKGLLFNITKDATIKNIVIQGSVDSNRYIGGVVGRTTGSMTLENVVVNADLTLNNGNANAVGGLIGQVGSGQTTGGGTISITNCAAFGTYSSATSTNPVGGLIGHIYGGYAVRINNSYAAASLNCNDGTVAGLIASQGTNDLRITNCYYLDSMAGTSLAVMMASTSDADPVDSESPDVDVAAVSAAYMTSADFLTDLNGAFVSGGANGYPLPNMGSTESTDDTENEDNTGNIGDTGNTGDTGSAAEVYIPDTIEQTFIDGEEYLVFDSGEDMAWLRWHIMNMEDGADEEGKYYCTHNIILADDIDMTGYNATYGVNNGEWSGIGWGQQWIGYSGIFDGNGHTISQIEVYTDTPVGPKGLLFNITKDATIRNLAVQGTVSANRYIGGLVGRTTGSITLENVVVNAALQLSDGNANAVGGLIGQVGSGQTVGGDTITIRNCAAVGTFYSMTPSNPVGGLIGHVYGGYTVRISNSYAAASLYCDGGTVAALIAGQGTADLMITNCYYLDSMADTPLVVMTSNGDANAVGSDSFFVQADAKTRKYMQSGDFLDDLQGEFIADGDTALAQGYPVPAGIIVTPKSSGTTIKDGVFTITVDTENLSEVLKTANADTQIVIAADIPADEPVGVVTAELTADQVAALADSGALLKVETPFADVILPNAALTALAAQSGSTAAVTVTAGAGGAAVITVAADGTALKSVYGGIKAEIPVTGGQVAVLVDDNGSESVIPKSVVKNGTAYVPLSGSAAVKIVNNAKTFADVNGSDWYSSYVDFASGHELFNGVSGTEFAPNTPMTRAMLVTVLYRLESAPAVTAADAFADVPADTWYTAAVSWANKNKIVEGYGNGSFGSGDSVTREQLATILYRYMQYLGLDVGASGSLSGFADSGDVSAWARNAMKWAVGAGIITGKSSTVLDPGGAATRAEVATMLQRLIVMMQETADVRSVYVS